MAATLPKSERLCGKSAVACLLERGRGGTEGCLRYRYLPREGGDGVSRILISVPKRNFKRAVKRNLLKRRIRESYRLNKQLLTGPVDVQLVYLPREVLSFEDICASMTAALGAIARHLC